MPISLRSAAGNGKKSGSKSNGKRAAGRPAMKTFINVQVKMSTRQALNELKSITGLKTQGDVLDRLLADVMQRRPKRGT
jgi:hypothetical protein